MAANWDLGFVKPIGLWAVGQPDCCNDLLCLAVGFQYCPVTVLRKLLVHWALVVDRRVQRVVIADVDANSKVGVQLVVVVALEPNLNFDWSDSRLFEKVLVELYCQVRSEPKRQFAEILRQIR